MRLKKCACGARCHVGETVCEICLLTRRLFDWRQLFDINEGGRIVSNRLSPEERSRILGKRARRKGDGFEERR